MQSIKNKTFAMQTELGLYCRTGMHEPSTSIQEHTFHYRRLVYNVVEDTLSTAYPLTRKLIGKRRWKKAVDHFFQNHKCETPQVWKLPIEFCQYYSEVQLPFKKDYPFINELLQYEWLEVEIFMMEDVPVKKFKMKKTANHEILIPNPEIKILSLQYPIHLKKAKQITEKDKAQYFVAIYRDHKTRQVRFSDLSYPFVEILIKINEEETKMGDLLILLSKYENNNSRVETTVDKFIEFAIRENLILGFKQ